MPNEEEIVNLIKELKKLFEDYQNKIYADLENNYKKTEKFLENVVNKIDLRLGKQDIKLENQDLKIELVKKEVESKLKDLRDPFLSTKIYIFIFLSIILGLEVYNVFFIGK